MQLICCIDSMKALSDSILVGGGEQKSGGRWQVERQHQNQLLGMETKLPGWVWSEYSLFDHSITYNM